MGLPPRSCATDAYHCIMVQVLTRPAEYKCVARPRVHPWRAPLGSRSGLTEQSPIQACPGEGRGDPDRAREVERRLVRDDHPAAGSLPCEPAWPCRVEPAGDDPLCQIRRAPAAQSAERSLCPRGRRPRRLNPRPSPGQAVADHVGAGAAVLSPLTKLIRRPVFAAERVHGDDTTVPLLAKGKTITARLWTYVPDDRLFAGPDPPAAIFFYSRNRAGEHPARHLAGYAGILQADASAGSGEPDDGNRKPGPTTEAAGWSHSRRKFFELADLRKAPLAVEAVRRIDELFAIERTINGMPAGNRLAARRRESRPIVTALEQWMRA